VIKEEQHFGLAFRHSQFLRIHMLALIQILTHIDLALITALLPTTTIALILNGEKKSSNRNGN
jgi:hypothetical protein